MKREERIETMVKELIETVANQPHGMCATIVLSAYESEDKKKIGQTIAAHGSPVAISAILVKAMEESDVLRDSIQMAGKMYDLMNGDAVPPIEAFFKGLR